MLAHTHTQGKAAGASSVPSSSVRGNGENDDNKPSSDLFRTRQLGPTTYLGTNTTTTRIKHVSTLQTFLVHYYLKKRGKYRGCFYLAGLCCLMCVCGGSALSTEEPKLSYFRMTQLSGRGISKAQNHVSVFAHSRKLPERRNEQSSPFCLQHLFYFIFYFFFLQP